jgi:hypothetical protein
LEQEDFVRAGRLAMGSSTAQSLRVCEKYEIRDDEILAKWPRQETSHWWAYEPLKDAPDLFLEFAALHEAADFAEAALAFSHKRGLPGGNGFFEPAVSPDNNSVRISLSAFQEETTLAWFILRVYEAALNRDEEQLRIAAKALEEAFQLEDDELSELEDDEVSETSEEQHANSALMQVVVMVSKVVQKHSYMIPHFTEDIGSLDTLTSGIRSSWAFANLLGAAYLQMWWLMTSVGDVTRCEYCSQIISLGRPHPEGRKRRSDKRFCNDSCRQSHHRSKKRAQDAAPS